MSDPTASEVSSLFDQWLGSSGAGGAGEPGTLAEALAALPAPAAEAAETAEDAAPVDRARAQRLVLFTVAGSIYGVPETFVTEVERIPGITIVPRAPGWLRGVTNVRGDVLSVIDLRLFLGLDAVAAHSGRMVVVRLLDQEFTVGLLVDGISQIASVLPDEIRPPAAPLDGTLAAYLTGVCQLADRLVAVIDLDRLLRSPEIRQFDEPQNAEAGA